MGGVGSDVSLFRTPARCGACPLVAMLEKAAFPDSNTNITSNIYSFHILYFSVASVKRQMCFSKVKNPAHFFKFPHTMPQGMLRRLPLLSPDLVTICSVLTNAPGPKGSSGRSEPDPQNTTLNLGNLHDRSIFFRTNNLL